MLTAARPGEVRFAEWNEIDFKEKIWTVPGWKVKGRKDKKKNHKVPLTKRAIEILKMMPAYSGERERSYRSNVNTFFLNALPTEVCTPGVHVQSIS